MGLSSIAEAHNAARATFAEIPHYGWFMRGKRLYQKLPNLNGANCYCMYEGYEHIPPSREVTPAPTPQLVGRPAPAARQRKIIELYSDGQYREVTP